MIRDICYLGNPILRKKCRDVKTINDEIRGIGQDLIDTLKNFGPNGIGLAAPQIGFDVRMFALSLSESVDEEGQREVTEPVVYCNPKITWVSKKKCWLQEGCLSIPKFYDDVLRPTTIDFEAIDLEGNKVVKRGLTDWMARVVLHEYDHLEGVLFFDHFSKEKLTRAQPTLKMIEIHYS
jgi:peptide deformylase